MAKRKAVLAARRAPDEAAVNAFISGKTTPAVVPEPMALDGRVVIERKDGRKMRRTTIYMDLELAVRVGMFAVKHGVDQTKVIKAALEEWLAKHGG